MSGAGDIFDVMRDGTNIGVQVLNACDVAELLGVEVDWVAARRDVLPCFDVPSDDGVGSLERMRVRIADLPLWKRAMREER